MRTIASMLTLLLAGIAHAEPTFLVSIADGLVDHPVSGRLVVYVVDESSAINEPPSAAPFFSDPQPVLGVDTQAWRPGETVVVGEGAERFPASGIEPGRYRAQAVLDRHRLNSRWDREAGNFYSGIVRFTLAEGESPEIALRLDEIVEEPGLPRAEGVEYRALQSKLLSDARGEAVTINAGVIAPIGYDPQQRYPVVYEVPGFGGDHTMAASRARELSRSRPTSPMGRLARSAFWIVLDPDGPNGHHLFLDSRANGPAGRALVEEVVPTIDQFYPTIAEPAARMLRGHSSGGWTVVHLALAYPETFGGGWSSAPDPLDFRAFQTVNIYEDDNMYADADGEPKPSYTDASGIVRMTIAEENAMETVLGPLNTSAQQWDSWQAAFGPVDEADRPARLYDERTGAIDRGVAERYRRADLAERVRRDPARVGRVARDRLRIIVGDADEFELDRGVELFVETLGGFGFEGEAGWYAVVPGATHGSVLESEAARLLMDDLADHAEAQLER